MADPYHTEEDQIRAMKQWWERNGSSTMVSVGFTLAIVFGWQWWQQQRQSNAEEAAALYQQLQQAVELARDDEVQRTTAKHLGEQLLLALAAQLVRLDPRCGAEGKREGEERGREGDERERPRSAARTHVHRCFHIPQHTTLLL